VELRDYDRFKALVYHLLEAIEGKNEKSRSRQCTGKIFESWTSQIFMMSLVRILATTLPTLTTFFEVVLSFSTKIPGQYFNPFHVMHEISHLKALARLVRFYLVFERISERNVYLHPKTIEVTFGSFSVIEIIRFYGNN
jgi:hypothetical protein